VVVAVALVAALYRVAAAPGPVAVVVVAAAAAALVQAVEVWAAVGLSPFSLPLRTPFTSPSTLLLVRLLLLPCPLLLLPFPLGRPL
jgi:hypothetical protein